MDFVTVDDLAEHRRAAQDWLADHVRPEWADEQYWSGTHHTDALHQQLAGDGILGAGWPAEYGGSDTDPDFARAVLDAVAGAGLYADGWATTGESSVPRCEFPGTHRIPVCRVAGTPSREWRFA